MSLEADWAAAKPAANDLQSAWDTAKPVAGTGRQPERALGAYGPTQERPAPPPEKPLGMSSFLDGIRSVIAEPLAAMGSGMVAGPVSNLAGLASTMSPQTATNPAHPQEVQERVRQSMTYEPRTKVGSAVAEYNPIALLGQLINWGAGKAEVAIAPPGSSIEREAGAHAVGEGMRQGAGFLGLGAPPVAAAAGRVLKGAPGEAGITARGMMQSALKPNQKAQRTGKAEAAVDTLLDEGINVTKGGAEKLQNKVDDLNTRIADVIANSPAVVDKELVVSRLQGNLKKALNEVNPQTSLATVEKAWTDFLNHPGLPGIDMPVQQAQAMKTQTNKSLKDKYGELGSTDVEAQKSLVRGLKEEIAKQVPEVRALNAEDSKLINALSLVEKRAMMEANKNPIGLGVLSVHPSHMAAWLVDRSGLFKSLIARMLNTASEAAPAAGRLGPPLGMAVSSQAQGIQPPPGR